MINIMHKPASNKSLASRFRCKIKILKWHYYSIQNCFKKAHWRHVSYHYESNMYRSFLAQFLHQVRLINLSGYAGDRLCTVEQHW